MMDGCLYALDTHRVYNTNSDLKASSRTPMKRHHQYRLECKVLLGGREASIGYVPVCGHEAYTALYT